MQYGQCMRPNAGFQTRPKAGARHERRSSVSDGLTQSGSCDRPLATAHLFFETRPTHIDLRPTRRPPHGGDGPTGFGRAALSLDITDPVQDHSTRFNFVHRFLLLADAERATGGATLASHKDTVALLTLRLPVGSSPRAHSSGASCTPCKCSALEAPG